MKLIASIQKAFLENLRDWKVLAMVLVFSPFFVVLMYLFYGGETTSYKIGVMNQDDGTFGSELTTSIEEMMGPENTPLFQVSMYKNYQQLEQDVKDKSIDIGLMIPVGYSKHLVASKGSETVPKVGLYGSMGNMKYAVAAIYATDAIYQKGTTVQEIVVPTYFEETFLEKKMPRNEFESYVPGLISLAVLMILFTASASIVKENDKKTLIRLKLSQLGAFHFLGGISIVQAVIATIALLISYGTALLLGYKPEGNLVSVFIIGLLSSVSMVAVSLVVASFLNTVFDVLTIGCFPFFIMMFFSGSMFPLPKISVFSIAGHSIGVTDCLPLTHTANAFNKILNDGANLSQVGYEMGMICLLTLVYFVIGLLLYQKRKLSKA